MNRHWESQIIHISSRYKQDKKEKQIARKTIKQLFNKIKTPLSKPIKSYCYCKFE